MQKEKEEEGKSEELTLSDTDSRELNKRGRPWLGQTKDKSFVLCPPSLL
jgi:hypothetical protein